MRRVRTSRLSRTSEKQNKRQAVLFTAGIILLVVVLIQFGPLIINVFGNAVYTLRGGDGNEQNNLVADKLYQAPTLIGIPTATQSSRISFSGVSSEDEGFVEIYVNDELEEEVELSGKKEFVVDNVRLSKGMNEIKSRYMKGDEASGFGEVHAVNYISEKPELEITYPSDGATLSRADKSITVTGTTDPDNSVSVNSFRAIVDSSGKFTYLLQLNDGENTINVEAINPAGATTQKQIKVTYSP